MDLNHRRLCRQIYSLLPLAAREPLPVTLLNCFIFQRAGDGNRTHYLLLTRQLLYQVSYASETLQLSFAVCLLAYLKGEFDRSKRRVSQGNSQNYGWFHLISRPR